MTVNTGFINHSCMAFHDNPGQLIPGENKSYTKNWLEHAGDALCWHAMYLPRHIVKAFANPKVVTVALTALALLAVQFAFYPIATTLAIKSICIFIARHLSLWAVKLASYILVQSAILGLGTRALGRFCNSDLMNRWHILQGQQDG